MAVKYETLDLHLLRKMFDGRTCTCGSCDQLSTAFTDPPRPGDRWAILFSFLSKSALCPFLTRIWEAMDGSVCHWNVCYGCLKAGKLPFLPSLTPIAESIDPASFQVLEQDNLDGQCPVHGQFFVPFCIGEPPRLLCMTTRTKLYTEKLVLFPLQMAWFGKDLQSQTVSAFAFIPNSRRWPLHIAYELVYDVTFYPSDDSSAFVHSYTYLFRRRTEPLAPFPLLIDLIEGLSPRLNVWNLQHEIMGSSNFGVAASGEGMFSQRVPLGQRKALELVARSPKLHIPHTKDSKVSKSNGLLTPQAGTKRDLELVEKREGLQVYTISKRVKENSSKDVDTKTWRGEDNGIPVSKEKTTNEHSLPANGAMNPQYKSPKKMTITPIKIDPVWDRDYIFAKNNDGFLEQDDGPASLRGDPTYVDEEEHVISHLLSGGTSSHSQKRPSRHFLFESDVIRAEKQDIKLQEKTRKLRESCSSSKALYTKVKTEMNAVSLNTRCEHRNIEQKIVVADRKYGFVEDLKPCAENLLKRHRRLSSFRTSYSLVGGMEYRTPLMRASSFKPTMPSLSKGRKTLSVSDAYKQLKEGKFALIRSSIDDVPLMTFEETVPRENEGARICLRVSVDIDSIDVLTTPMGGLSFNNSPGSIPLTWNRGFSRSDEAQYRNNGFTCFFRAYSEQYPGNYFGSKVQRPFKGKPEEGQSLHDAIQVQLCSINVSWNHPVKVFAIIPSKSLLYFLKGHGAFLELFERLAFPEDGRAERLSTRSLLSQMVWYIFTSGILLFCSIGSRNGNMPGIWSRKACCAFSSVDQTRDEMHDGKYGHLSDINAVESLSEGTLTVGLCLFARHQRALEQHSCVPEHLRCAAFEKIRNYNIPESLYGIVNENVLHVLKADIGSDTCLRWFQSFWASGNYSFGDFVRLRSDGSRRGENAFPSSESCRDAFKRGYLCLEDLNPLSASILRGTVHGTKTTAYTVIQLHSIREKLYSSFNPSCFEDGIIDVAYVFHSPPEADFSVHLRRNAVSDPNTTTSSLIIPLGCENTFKELGAYLSASPGFPEFVGFSTRRGSCGNQCSGVSAYGVRKVKAYATKWKGDSYRGRTIYESKAALSLRNKFSNPHMLYAKVVAAQKKGNDKLEKYFAEVKKHYDIVMHNLNHRQQLLETYQSTDGLRIEFSCFFDPEFHILEEPLDILQMMEERLRMTDETVVRILSDNPEHFPWWMKVPGFLQDRINASIPVSFVSNRVLHKFCLLLERRALQLSFEIFVRGSIFLSRKQMPCLSWQSHFLDSTLEGIQKTENAAKFVTVLSTALYRLSNRQVDNMLCDRLGIPCTPDGWMAASGIYASWWYCGYPSVILSRLCRFSSFSCGYELTNHDETRVSIISKEGILITTEEDYKLPWSLRYSAIRNHQSVKALRISGNDEFVGQVTTLTSITKIMDALFRVSEEEANRDDVVLKVSTFVVKMLLADIGHTLMLSSFSEPHFQEKKNWETKFGESLSERELSELCSIAKHGRMWPDEYRLDKVYEQKTETRGTDISIDAKMEELKACYDLSGRLSKVLHGDRWSRNTLAIDENGMIKDEDFVRTLIKEAHSSRRKPEQQDMSSDREWLSVLSIESFMDVIEHNGHGKSLSTFLSLLAQGISRNMHSAGFHIISPAFLKRSSGFAREAKSLWGPDMLFAKMRFKNVKGSIDFYLEEEETEPDSLMEIKKVFRELSAIEIERQSASISSDHWMRLSQMYRDTSDQFWSIPGVESRLLEALETAFEAGRDEKSLMKLDLVWLKKLLGKLVQIRKTLGDEGLYCEIINDEIASCRDLDILPTLGHALQLPWCELYPDAVDVYKKKTRVRQAGRLFSSTFPLLFKAKGLREVQKRKRKSVCTTKNCFLFTVEDVFRCLSLPFDEETAIKKGQWRLAPTRIIAKIILGED